MRGDPCAKAEHDCDDGGDEKQSSRYWKQSTPNIKPSDFGATARTRLRTRGLGWLLPSDRRHFLSDAFGNHRMVEHRAGRGQNEIIEWCVLRTNDAAVTRFCDYQLRRFDGAALVCGVVCFLRCSRFIRITAPSAVSLEQR